MNSTEAPSNVTSGVNFTDEEITIYLHNLSEKRTNEIFLAAIIVISILGVIGLIGNTLVIIIYTKYFKHNPSRVFILALAAFDLTSNILCVPGEIVDLLNSFTFPSAVLCKFIRFNNYFATIASILILVAISIERFKKICRPHSTQIKEKHAYKIVAMVVVVTLFVSSPAAILSGLRTKETEISGIYGHDCTFSDRYRWTIYPKLFLASQFLVLVVCATLLIVLYCMIGMAIYRHKRRRYTLTAITMTKPSVQRSSNESPETSTDTTTERQPQENGVTGRKGSIISTIINKITNKCSPKNNQSSAENGHVSDKRRDSAPVVEKYKTTFMLLTITIAFVLSYSPYLIISLIKISNKDFEKTLSIGGYITYTVFLRSYFLNSAVNSIIYSFWNKTFRDGIIKLFSLKNNQPMRQNTSQAHSF